MNAYRSALLYFKPDGTAIHDADGLLVTAPNAHGIQEVLAIGPWSALKADFAHVPVQHLPAKKDLMSGGTAVPNHGPATAPLP